MPSLTSSLALEDMLCRFVIELKNVPTPVELMPEAFLGMLPDNDYVPVPVVWEPAHRMAKKLVDADSNTDECYQEFNRLIVSILTGLNRRLSPEQIFDPYFRILRDAWRDDNLDWVRSEIQFHLHLIRPELRHPDFGDTIKGVRITKPRPVSSDIVQDLVDSFYVSNPDSVHADKLIRDIVRGKSMRYKSDLGKTASN